MDLFCTNCLEPWDLLHVVDNPDKFDRMGTTGNITSCPSCHGKPKDLSAQERFKAAVIADMAELLGDDIDGLAVDIEDAEYMGMFNFQDAERG